MQNNINQKKKEILLKILDTLTDSWDIAKGIYVLVQGLDPEDEVIDSLIEIMQTSMKSIKDEKAKEKMQKGMDILKKMQDIEKAEREEELKLIESSLDELDELL